jgi:hypothetical protein
MYRNQSENLSRKLSPQLIAETRACHPAELCGTSAELHRRTMLHWALIPYVAIAMINR